MTTRLLIGFIASLVSASAFAEGQYSVVRVQMPDQYSVISIQKTADNAICRKANADYVKEMRAKCPTCKVQSARCETALKGSAAALMTKRSLKSYSVTAGDTRLLVSGKEDKARPACEQLAKELSAKGVSASCVAPGQQRS